MSDKVGSVKLSIDAADGVVGGDGSSDACASATEITGCSVGEWRRDSTKTIVSDEIDGDRASGRIRSTALFSVAGEVSRTH